MKTLARVQQDRWLAGICSGFAYAVGAPTWLTRFVAAILLPLSGFGIFIYLGLWVFMPRWQMDPVDYQERTTPVGTVSSK